jgi:hypothetical protein
MWVKKDYSKLREGFLLNKLAIFDKTVSIGHTSHGIFDECLSRCFSNFTLDSKIKSQLVQ